MTYWANECGVVFLPEGYDLLADYIYRCQCQEWNRRELQRRQMADELLAQRIAQWQAENRATGQTERTEPPTNAQPESQTADPGQLAAAVTNAVAAAQFAEHDDQPGPWGAVDVDEKTLGLESATDGADLPSEALLDEFTEEELLPDPAKPEPYEYVEKTDRTGVAYVEVRSGGKLVGRFEKRTGRWGALRDGVFLAEGQRYIEPREPTSQELAVQGASSLPVVTAAAGAASVGQGLKILGKEIAEEAGDYLADKLGIPLLGPTSLLKPRRTLGAADDAGKAARKRLKQGDDAADGSVAAGPLATKGGTYMLIDPETGQVMRTGRTGDLIRRQKEHARHPETKSLEFNLDRRTDDYSQQRGREQIIHDQYSPPMNRIRPVSPKNPQLQQYLDSAKEIE